MSREPAGKLRVGALVDLKLRPTAGGHVKCWEHFAEAATRIPHELDLTVHFQGERDEERVLAENVRFRLLRRVLSTGMLPLPAKQPDHSDLAPVHRRLQRFFGEYDVLHATDCWFAYAKTAMRHHRRTGKPLVCSTHTDVPNYARVFVRNLVDKIAGRGRIRRYLLHGWKVHRRAKLHLGHQFDEYLRECDFVLASSDIDYQHAMHLLPSERVRRLRRGIDKQEFHPKRRNRRLIEERYHIPPDRFLVLFVGRLDEAKQATVVGRAIKTLVERGMPVHGLFVGQGPLRDKLERELGPAATFTGSLGHDELRDVYASSDLFAFPSTTEVMPNVVVEAKTCGLPVVISSQGGSGQMVEQSGRDGILIDGSEPAEWAAIIERLYREEAVRRSLGEAARRHIETGWPSWDDVLRQDLLPVWHEAAEIRKKCESGNDEPGRPVSPRRH